MQTITIEELINYKILPFNIYSKDGELLFATGENLTPGKFLRLRDEETLYRVEDDEIDSDEKQETEEKTRKPVNIDMPLSVDIQSSLQYDYLDYRQTKNNADKLAEQIYFIVKNDFRRIEKLSALRLLGDYEDCHDLNTAIISAFYLQKNGHEEDEILNVISEILSGKKDKEIVKIASFADDLAFNQTEYRVNNMKDVLKILLLQYSKHYSAKTLYSFVYMFNYNDTELFDEMKR